MSAPCAASRGGGGGRLPCRYWKVSGLLLGCWLRGCWAAGCWLPAAGLPGLLPGGFECACLCVRGHILQGCSRVWVGRMGVVMFVWEDGRTVFLWLLCAHVCIMPV